MIPFDIFFFILGIEGYVVLFLVAHIYFMTCYKSVLFEIFDVIYSFLAFEGISIK